MPGQVAAAVRAHDATCNMAMPRLAPPGQLVTIAIGQAAQQAVADAGASGTVTLDRRALLAARVEEAELNDLLTIAVAARELAATALVEAVDQHAGPLTTAVQGRHAAVAGELARLGSRLPHGFSDQAALEAGDPLRADYLKARDLAAELGLAAESLAVIRADDSYQSPPGDLERCITFCRSEYLFDHRRDFAADPFGGLQFYLKLVREVAPVDLWCPTVAEVESRCRELREAARRERLERADTRR